MTYNKGIAERIREHLDEIGWKYSFNEQTGVFRYSVHGVETFNVVDCTLSVTEHGLVTDTLLPLSVEGKDTCRRLRDFMNRLNVIDRDGWLWIDEYTGEAGYRVSIDCGSGMPDEELVLRSVHEGNNKLDLVAEGISAAVFKEMDVDDAYHVMMDYVLERKLTEILEYLASSTDSDDGFEEDSDSEDDFYA